MLIMQITEVRAEAITCAKIIEDTAASMMGEMLTNVNMTKEKL